MEHITSDPSQKTTLKGAEWNSLFTAFWVWDIGAHVDYAKTWVYWLQSFKQWADFKNEQGQHSLVNPCHAPGRFDVSVMPLPGDNMGAAVLSDWDWAEFVQFSRKTDRIEHSNLIPAGR